MDFSSFDEELKDTDEATLLENLTNFGINIPEDSHFNQIDTGTYEWIIDKK
ncbi:hypothetical protein ACI2OX_12965 [Bacillus sp. N9]